jgi:mono/diheme cytochrome c family protein
MRPLALCCALAFASLSCADEPPPAADPPPSYAKEIRPFLSNYCQGCHSGRRAKSGYSVENYTALVKNGKKGPLVVPGKPDESRLTLCLDGKGKPMPPKKSDQPTAEEIAKVRAWIKAGAKDDKTPPEKTPDGDK